MRSIVIVMFILFVFFGTGYADEKVKECERKFQKVMKMCTDVIVGDRKSFPIYIQGSQSTSYMGTVYYLGPSTTVEVSHDGHLLSVHLPASIESHLVMAAKSKGVRFSAQEITPFIKFVTHCLFISRYCQYVYSGDSSHLMWDIGYDEHFGRVDRVSIYAMAVNFLLTHINEGQFEKIEKLIPLYLQNKSLISLQLKKIGKW